MENGCASATTVSFLNVFQGKKMFVAVVPSIGTVSTFQQEVVGVLVNKLIVDTVVLLHFVRAFQVLLTFNLKERKGNNLVCFVRYDVLVRNDRSSTLAVLRDDKQVSCMQC